MQFFLQPLITQLLDRSCDYGNSWKLAFSVFELIDTAHKHHSNHALNHASYNINILFYRGYVIFYRVYFEGQVQCTSV